MKKSNVILINGKTDEEKVASLRQLASKPSKGRYKRHVCLQVASQQLLRQLQTRDMGDGIAEKLQLHPYSFEELWAQKLFVSLPRRRVVSCPLDRKPVLYDSDYRVHLVVFGMNQMTEALVRQACLVCHYPNYLRDSSLKTCITVIDPNIKEDNNLFIRRYQMLMDYCRWSFVDKHGCEIAHKPECEYLGGEFTDVEFRFVSAEFSNTIVRVMMTELARNPKEMVTVAFAGEDAEMNWDLATGLPAEYYIEGCDIPIYVRMKSTMMLSSSTYMPQYRNIKPFGMDDCEFDLSLPLTQMAIGVSYIYDHCYNTGDVYCDKIDRRKAMEIWQQEKAENRFSSEALAMTIITKFRNRGKAEDEPIKDDEIAVMAEVEHNRWSVERLLNGFRPVTPDEQKAIEEARDLRKETDKAEDLKKKLKKELHAHYDLRPYCELSEDFAGHNAKLYDEALVRGLQPILDAFEKHDTGEKMIVVKREIEDKSGRWKKIAIWAAASLVAILSGLMIYSFWCDYKAEDNARESLGKYVYKLRVDSIEVWNGNNGVERVLHRNCRDKVVGTAFSLDGVGIVTARHCVEYWLYDSVHVVNDTSKWFDEMRLASEIETYNDTTSGEKKRMVSICSILDENNEVLMDRLVFEVDYSHDFVCKIGNSGGKWRYVVPIFERDRDMLQSDVALFRRRGIKGIKLCDELSDIEGNTCYLGYPNDSDDRTFRSKKTKISKLKQPFVKFDDEVAKGCSGGPLVVWDYFGRFSVVGVVSHTDPIDKSASWAIIVNLKR